MMYKFTSGMLLVSVLVLGTFFLVEKCDHDKIKKKYNNAVAELEGVKQETETAISVRALIEEDLKAQADALQEILNDRDEKILSQTKVNFRLKKKLFKIRNAKETVVDQEGKVVVVTESNKCDDTLRHRVDFKVVDKPLRARGYTLTNPAYVELKLDWIKDFQLEINLTKDGDGKFRVYVDSSDFEFGDLTLKVDPKILEVKWYQRISLGADLYAGEFGAGLSLRPGYDVLDHLNVNLLFVFQYSEKSAKMFYGLGVTWYPWR